MSNQAKDKPLTAKQASFVQYYADPESNAYNNATMACLMAGYAETSAKVSGCKNITKYNVKQAIKGYRDEIGKELQWGRSENLAALTKQIGRYETLLDANPNNQQALAGIDRVIREFNASSGQHSQVINTNNKTLGINVVQRQAPPQATVARSEHLHVLPLSGQGQGENVAQGEREAVCEAEEGEGGGSKLS